jgi:hypothetical protein
MPTTGVVRLENLSLNMSLVNVNGLTFTLAPGEVREASVPAGTFTYQVLADGRGFPHAQQLRTVPANGWFRISIQP